MRKHIYSKIPLSQTIVALCEAKGISKIVISPGSRNAPLTIGFTENPNMECYSIVDERCAAFFALGMAQQLKEPVALVCTSGSALLNYYPAIAEAYYSDIPLVAISADRPIERIDIGDGQTIRQKNVFDNHILYSANLHSEIVLQQITSQEEKVLQKQREAQKHNEREINKALNTAIEYKGPVHINAPFYEPLYDKVEEALVTPRNIPPEKILYTYPEDLKNEMHQLWNSASRKLVMIGVNSPKMIDNTWISNLLEDPSVLIFTETTSNIYHPRIINCIDQLIAALDDDGFKALQPDILVTIGGFIVSKKIKAFLRTYQPKAHWHIDEKKAFDTYFCLTEHIKMHPNDFFKTFLPDTKKIIDSDYQSYWLTIRDHRRKKHEEYIDSVIYSDMLVFSELLEKIPEDYDLQLSNSSTIRYTQLFSLKDSQAVFCNRGTSGIDGSTSTAIGAALVSRKPTVLITGDLSFFYDTNALWNGYIPQNFKIIIINNSGGGIFRILPGKENTTNFSRFFETTHDLTAEHLCKMYGFKYHKANDQQTLKNALTSFFNDVDQPQILEVFTPRETNDRVLIDYFKHLI
ncbi:2-succinyl-5-enolpyruvyl-6-hydroxy-3-cyclohexene-1-carboxylic-acid synthase [Aquimarina rhabdastrellae]